MMQGSPSLDNTHEANTEAMVAPQRKDKISTESDGVLKSAWICMRLLALLHTLQGALGLLMLGLDACTPRSIHQILEVYGSTVCNGVGIRPRTLYALRKKKPQ